MSSALVGHEINSVHAVPSFSCDPLSHQILINCPIFISPIKENKYVKLKGYFVVEHGI